MNPCEPFNTSNAIALYHELKAKDGLTQRKPHGIKRLVLRFKNDLAAFFTAIPLNAIFILTKLFALSRTVVTSHIMSLSFFARLAHNVFAEGHREQSRLVFNKG